MNCWSNRQRHVGKLTCLYWVTEAGAAGAAPDHSVVVVRIAAAYNAAVVVVLLISLADWVECAGVVCCIDLLIEVRVVPRLSPVVVGVVAWTISPVQISWIVLMNGGLTCRSGAPSVPLNISF